MSSQLKVECLSDELKQKSLHDFDEMFALRPENKHKVVVKNFELQVCRFQQSFLKTPTLSFLEKKDAEYKKKSSYMFSGHDDTKNNGELPAVFQPYFDYIKSKFPDCDFNQVSINWYENGQDYIAFHRDCEVGMKGNKNICILTFNETEKEEDARNLEFKFDTKVIGKSLQENFSIPLYHGSIVILTSQIQKYYRHGIKQSPISTRRISMSFRQFEE